MPYPNTYYYFLKENYPQVICNESSEFFARLPLVSPEREEVVVGGENYQILEHQVVVYEDLVADLPRQNNYSYVAILSMREAPFLKMEVAIDACNFQNSRVTFREVASNLEKSITLSSLESKVLKRMAAFFSTPGMREIHSKKRLALQDVIGAYSTRLKQLWAAKPQERLFLVDDLIIKAQHMSLLGGQNFVHLLERLKRNIVKKQNATELYGFQLVGESGFVEDETDDDLVWVEDATTTGESISLRERMSQEFWQKYAVVNFAEGEVKERIAALTLSELHAVYARMQELMLLLSNDEVVVSFAKIKRIIKVTNITLRAIVERSRETLLTAVTEEELAVLSGSVGLRYLDDGILAELVSSRKYLSLGWLLNSGHFTTDLISVTHDSEELSLLEFAIRLDDKDAFLVLLYAGANPIFVTRQNRCFAHDILQANLRFAEALCAVKSVSIVLSDFFQELAAIVKIWQKYVDLDTDIEQPELQQICRRYVGYFSEEDVEELKFSGDHFSEQFAAAMQRTGLSGEFLRRYLVVNELQQALRDFLVAYQDFHAEYRSDPRIPKTKGQVIQQLVSHLQNHLIVSEKSSLRKTINLLTRATSVIRHAQQVIEVYRKIDDNNLSVNPTDKADARRVRLANEAQEKELRNYIMGSNGTYPSKGGFWSTAFSGSLADKVSSKVLSDEHGFIFAGPLLDILNAARTNSEHKVASMS